MKDYQSKKLIENLTVFTTIGGACTGLFAFIPASRGSTIMLFPLRHFRFIFVFIVLGAIAILGIGGLIAMFEASLVMRRLGKEHPGVRLDVEPQLTEASERLAHHYAILLVLCLIFWVAVWTTPATFAFLISTSTFTVFLLTQLDIKARLVPVIKRYLFDQKPEPVEPKPEPEPEPKPAEPGPEPGSDSEPEPKPDPDPKSKFHHSRPRDCRNRRNVNLPRLRK